MAGGPIRDFSVLVMVNLKGDAWHGKQRYGEEAQWH